MTVETREFFRELAEICDVKNLKCSRQDSQVVWVSIMMNSRIALEDEINQIQWVRRTGLLNFPKKNLTFNISNLSRSNMRRTQAHNSTRESSQVFLSRLSTSNPLVGVTLHISRDRCHHKSYFMAICWSAYVGNSTTVTSCITFVATWEKKLFPVHFTVCWLLIQTSSISMSYEALPNNSHSHEYHYLSISSAAQQWSMKIINLFSFGDLLSLPEIFISTWNLCLQAFDIAAGERRGGMKKFENNENLIYPNCSIGSSRLSASTA